ncbi:MAG: tellurite resistance TerB family protein [Candidatus Electronema sp. V4]|uniref:tellurite resistance TerB family protein n=1 Tax=Candidatus Electronema sp. V4 TaxID=3454756 RepID=UPI00405564BA
MNIEKLLGKLLQEAMGSGGGQFKAPQQGYQKSGHAGRQAASSGSLLGSLTSQLTSGKGLMTAIGLGVGAYEVFRTSGQRQEQPAAQAPNWGAAPSAPAAAAPPPPPPSAARPAPVPAAAPSADGDEELARRLIRVMIAAAHADGALDADEERAILDRLRGAELSQEEKMFLLEELHHPRSVAELTEGISSLRLGQAIYAVALSAVTVDTESERRWLDELGAALSLSAEIRRFIEETR